MILLMLTHNKSDLRVPQVDHFSHLPISQDDCKTFKICQNWHAQKYPYGKSKYLLNIVSYCTGANFDRH